MLISYTQFCEVPYIFYCIVIIINMALSKASYKGATVSDDWLNLYHVAVIGNTGVGKSALCNYLTGKKKDDMFSFHESAGIDSYTNQTTAQKVKWMGNGEEFILVDTPGYGDTSGQDSLHIAEMVREMKKLGFMNAFLILFNSQHPRLDQPLRSMIQIFTEIFGADRFYDNVILGFTRFEHSDRAERSRVKSGQTRDNFKSEFNHYFRQSFGVKKEIPALFFDAYPDEEDLTELRRNAEEVKKLVELTYSFSPFPLEDAQAVRNHLDKLKDKIDEQSGRADAAEEEAQRNAAMAEKERVGREKDREDHKQQMGDMETRHNQKIHEIEVYNQKQHSEIQQQVENARKRQLELERQLCKAKKSKGGFSLGFGPLSLSVDF